MMMIQHADLYAPYDPDRDDLMVLPIADRDAPDYPLDGPTHSLELVRGGTRYAVTLVRGDRETCQGALVRIAAAVDSTHPPSTFHL